MNSRRRSSVKTERSTGRFSGFPVGSAAITRSNWSIGNLTVRSCYDQQNLWNLWFLVNDVFSPVNSQTKPLMEGFETFRFAPAYKGTQFHSFHKNLWGFLARKNKHHQTGACPPVHFSIWVFPKIGVPPNHPIFNRVFHEINHPFWGKHPYFWETSISKNKFQVLEYVVPAHWVVVLVLPLCRPNRPWKLQLGWQLGVFCRFFQWFKLGFMDARGPRFEGCFWQSVLRQLEFGRLVHDICWQTLGIDGKIISTANNSTETCPLSRRKTKHIQLHIDLGNFWQNHQAE